MNSDLWSEHPPESESFGSRLEAQAARIVERDRSDNKDHAGVERVLAREIELVLGQVQEARDIHGRQLRSLLRVECYVDTDLMQMEQRTPRYSPERFPEREKLQRRLMAIEAERRSLATDHAVRLSHLHDRLLVSLNRHAQVVP